MSFLDTQCKGVAAVKVKKVDNVYLVVFVSVLIGMVAQVFSIEHKVLGSLRVGLKLHIDDMYRLVIENVNLLINVQ